MRKRLFIISLSIAALAFIVGSFSNAVFNIVKAENEVSADVCGVQVRSDGIDNYVVINDNQLDLYSAAAFTDVSEYNAPEYINLFMEAGGEPIKLSAIMNENKWWSNYWGSHGIMFPISNYETYNGLSIYAIEILEGCTYPNNRFQTVTVLETKTYINNSYLYDGPEAEAIKMLSVDWPEAISYERGEIELGIDGGELRSNYNDVEDPEHNLQLLEFFIAVKASEYFNQPVGVYGFFNLKQINAYENIIVHLSDAEEDEGELLSKIASGRYAKSNYWGNSQTFMFSLTREEYEVYNGASVYSITILEECELIYNNTICKVTRSVDLINPHYHDNDYKYNNFELYVKQGPEVLDEPISLTGAQLRGQMDPDGIDANNLLYLDLLSNAYEHSASYTYDSVVMRTLNAYDKITLYLSEDDEGKKLGEIAQTYQEGIQNQFNTAAFFFRLGTDEYEKYNGLSVYKVVVEEGCELLVSKKKAVVDKTYTFVNSNYGLTFPDTEEGREAEKVAKLSGFDFPSEVTEKDLVNFGDIAAENIHNRMDKTTESRWLIFFFDDMLGNTSTSVKHYLKLLKFLDNVLIYYEKDGDAKTLKDIYDERASGVAAGATVCQFGITNSIGVSILNPRDDNNKFINDGPHMYKIEILAGTKIPAMKNNVPGYYVLKDKVLFTNDEYGKTGNLPANRPERLDENNIPRTYEDWNVYWTLFPCYVSFTVEGIEGLSFPGIYLNIGDRVSLEDYAQEGYDVSARTTDGNKIYRCIIGTTHSINVILTYTVHIDEDEEPEQPEQKQGCGGSVEATSIISSIVLLTSIGLIFIRKRKEQ